MPKTTRQVLTSPSFPARLHHKSFWCFAATVLLSLLAAGTLSAQTFRGNILGTVSDANGAVIPAADVTARNQATGLERTAVTDEAGNYSISELQIGNYRVTVTNF